MTPDSSRKKQDLLEAAQAAVASQPDATTIGTGPRETRWGLVWGCLAAILITAGAVLALRPEWVFPSPPALETPELADASLRLAIVRERQRIEAFRTGQGRLPATVAEAGGVLPGLELIAGPADGYLLRYPMAGEALELRSTDSLEGFLGNSLQVILTRGER